MKIKTSELTGAALDWVVAKCRQMRQEGDWLLDADSNGYLLRPHFDGMSRLWSPSTDWAQGGPIIERELIDVVRVGISNRCASRSIEDGSIVRGYGPTFLIAAMRCYVASKLGTEIDVPEELFR